MCFDIIVFIAIAVIQMAPDQSGCNTLGQTTLYHNHVITTIIVAIDIVTECYFMDHCDYFSCREFHVLFSDFIMNTDTQNLPQGSEWRVPEIPASPSVTTPSMDTKVSALAWNPFGENK